MNLKARAARIDDVAAIAAIYNEGIADRIATFEAEWRSAEQVYRWFDGHHPIVVVEDDDGVVVAFASTFTYRDRACYARSTSPVDIVASVSGASPWRL